MYIVCVGGWPLYDGSSLDSSPCYGMSVRAKTDIRHSTKHQPCCRLSCISMPMTKETCLDSHM